MPIVLHVDDINETKTFGITNDVDTVELNCAALGDHNFWVGVHTAQGLKGAGTVFTAGCYLVVLTSNKTETQKQMMFFDHRVNVDVRQDHLLGSILSERMLDRFEMLRDELKREFAEIDDNVVLIKT